MSTFDCGNREAGAEPWEEEVNLWIRNQSAEAILYDIPKYSVDVWLYTNTTNHFIGFGSLSSKLWDFEGKGKDRLPINVLYMVGIDRYYQSKGGSGDPNTKYSHQIIVDLFAKARARENYSPLLGLYVHPQNIKARGWYEKKLGFAYLQGTSEYSDVYKVEYPAMWINLLDLKSSLRGTELPEAPHRSPFLAPSPVDE